MKFMLESYLNFGIHGPIDPSLRIRIRLLNILNLACMVISLMYAWINKEVHEIASIINLIAVCGNMVIYLLVYRHQYITAFFTLMMVNVFTGLTLVILFGKYLAADLLFCTGVAYAIAMFEKRSYILVGALMNVACYIGSMYIYEVYTPVFHYLQKTLIPFYYPNSALFLCTLFAMVYLLKTENRRYENNLKLKNEELKESSKKNEELIENILPHSVARELKQKGSVEPRIYKNVTVMFTDFYQFTKTAERMSAMELVKELDEYFTAFDHIIASHGLEKLKTIGDAYMCASGVPDPREDHAHIMIKAALDICKKVNELKENNKNNNKPWWEIRIGIHSGNVVAGIIGETKFSFDIWGDTVNTASRMESSSEPGKINISQTTYDLVKDSFACVHRGKITAKNKGEIDMYFVEE